jgi:predicted TIM-barrel fold metal-dependent hydrolase
MTYKVLDRTWIGLGNYIMTVAASTPCVDTDFHLFEAGQAVAGARYVPAYAATLDQWMALATAVGVSHGVLVQPSFLGTDNRLTPNALAALPGRLIGVAVVAPTISAREMAEMHSSGVRGVRLNLWVVTMMSGTGHRPLRSGTDWLNLAGMSRSIPIPADCRRS